jgi:hypothetical protein
VVNGTKKVERQKYKKPHNYYFIIILNFLAIHIYILEIFLAPCYIQRLAENPLSGAKSFHGPRAR